jgi:hypothetical protein
LVNLNKELVSMVGVDRDLMRSRARQFIQSPEFDVYFGDMHPDAREVRWAMIFKSLTIVGIPQALRLGRAVRKQHLAGTPQLKDRYRRLADEGVVVRAEIVMSSSALNGDPTACAPALILVSLAGTDEGDANADKAIDLVFDRVQFGDELTPADKQVEAMMADEEYQATRKRQLPVEFTGGPKVWFVDVKISNRLLRSGKLSVDPLYFLIGPTDSGLAMQIPQEGSEVLPQRVL